VAEAIHIGQAAKVSGASVDTIRFYQKLGLIKSATRSAGGYRLFDEEQIRDLQFVRHAQELGFSLSEIKELLALRKKHHACSEVQSMLECKLTDVRAKIEGLGRLEAELRGALRTCNRAYVLTRQPNMRTAVRYWKGLTEPISRTGNAMTPVEQEQK